MELVEDVKLMNKLDLSGGKMDFSFHVHNLIFD